MWATDEERRIERESERARESESVSRVLRAELLLSVENQRAPESSREKLEVSESVCR